MLTCARNNINIVFVNSSLFKEEIRNEYDNTHSGSPSTSRTEKTLENHQRIILWAGKFVWNVFEFELANCYIPFELLMKFMPSGPDGLPKMWQV